MQELYVKKTFLNTLSLILPKSRRIYIWRDIRSLNIYELNKITLECQVNIYFILATFIKLIFVLFLILFEIVDSARQSFIRFRLDSLQNLRKVKILFKFNETQS